MFLLRITCIFLWKIQYFSQKIAVSCFLSTRPFPKTQTMIALLTKEPFTPWYSLPLDLPRDLYFVSLYKKVRQPLKSHFVYFFLLLIFYLLDFNFFILVQKWVSSLNMALQNFQLISFEYIRYVLELKEIATCVIQLIA